MAAVREDKEEKTPARASTLQILGATRAGHTASREVGLVFVPLVVNRKKVSALACFMVQHIVSFSRG